MLIPFLAATSLATAFAQRGSLAKKVAALAAPNPRRVLGRSARSLIGGIFSKAAKDIRPMNVNI